MIQGHTIVKELYFDIKMCSKLTTFFHASKQRIHKNSLAPNNIFICEDIDMFHDVNIEYT